MKKILELTAKHDEIAEDIRGLQTVIDQYDAGIHSFKLIMESKPNEEDTYIEFGLMVSADEEVRLQKNLIKVLRTSVKNRQHLLVGATERMKNAIKAKADKEA